MNRMKRSALFLAAVWLLTACAGDPASSASQPTTAVPEATRETEPMGDTRRYIAADGSFAINVPADYATLEESNGQYMFSPTKEDDAVANWIMVTVAQDIDDKFEEYTHEDIHEVLGENAAGYVVVGFRRLMLRDMYPAIHVNFYSEEKILEMFLMQEDGYQYVVGFVSDDNTSRFSLLLYAETFVIRPITGG